MNTSQTTLTDDDPTDEQDDPLESITDKHKSSSSTGGHLAPPDQRGGEGCCPWCLAASETFRHHDDGTVGCGYCDAAIPVDTDWYKRGEKIAV